MQKKIWKKKNVLEFFRKKIFWVAPNNSPPLMKTRNFLFTRGGELFGIFGYNPSVVICSMFRLFVHTYLILDVTIDYYPSFFIRAFFRSLIHILFTHFFIEPNIITLTVLCARSFVHSSLYYSFFFDFTVDYHSLFLISSFVSLFVHILIIFSHKLSRFASYTFVRLYYSFSFV